MKIMNELLKKEKDCFEYCMVNANAYFLGGEFEKAAIYLENARRSLEELQRFHNEKIQVEKAWEQLKQLNHDQLLELYERTRQL